jgi:ABC-type antimicrobial peptide transport system permease subunit
MEQSLMQTRRQSLIETLAGVAIGFILSMVLSYIVYPLHGHAFTLAQNVSITVIFTVASILRGYGVRRFFNWLWRTV